MFSSPIPQKSVLSRHIDGGSVFMRGLEKGGQWLGGYWLLSRDSRSHSRSCEGLLQGPLVSHQLYSESKHTNIKILQGPLVSHQPDQVGNQSTPIWASSLNVEIGKIEKIVCELREFYIFKAVLSWILKSINLESSSSNSSLLLISSQLEISIREFPPLFQMYFHSFNIQTSFPLFLLLCETSLDLVGNEKV